MTICQRCDAVLDDDPDGPVIRGMCTDCILPSDFAAVLTYLEHGGDPEKFELWGVQ